MNIRSAFSNQWSFALVSVFLLVLGAFHCSPSEKPCANDSECSAPLKRCISGVCKECRDVLDCSGKMQCVENTCRECARDRDCGAGFLCSTEYKCVKDEVHKEATSEKELIEDKKVGPLREVLPEPLQETDASGSVKEAPVEMPPPPCAYSQKRPCYTR